MWTARAGMNARAPCSFFSPACEYTLGLRSRHNWSQRAADASLKAWREAFSSETIWLPGPTLHNGFSPSPSLVGIIKVVGKESREKTDIVTARNADSESPRLRFASELHQKLCDLGKITQPL